MTSKKDYEEGFIEFLEEGINSENREKYRVAVSNYYKALVELCNFIICTKLDKYPANHSEIFLFLKTYFPGLYKIVDSLFDIYTNSYDEPMRKEDCTKIKNGIKEVTKISRIEGKIKESINKI